jgi:hypothetical protein
MQYKHMFKSVEDGREGLARIGRFWRLVGVSVTLAGTSSGVRREVPEILTFTLGVANLNMTVRQSDPGAAGVVTWCERSFAGGL